jgi:very-short-patch-repair endonuclease
MNDQEREMWRREDRKARAGQARERMYRIGEILKPSPEDKAQLADEMRRSPTKAEASLGSLLDREWPGRFQPQVVLYGWIVDLFDEASELVIELDGRGHEIPARAIRDDTRDSALTRRGYTVLRFTNEHLKLDPAGILETIRALIR